MSSWKRISNIWFLFIVFFYLDSHLNHDKMYFKPNVAHTHQSITYCAHMQGTTRNVTIHLGLRISHLLYLDHSNPAP